MKLGLGLGIGRGGGRLSAPVITATVSPVTQAVTDGDTWADLLLASATETANYASTASPTISSAVAEVQVDGGAWTALSGNEANVVAFDEVIATRVTVTDGLGNFRVFSAGTVTVAGIAPSAIVTDSFVPSTRTLTITVDNIAGVPFPERELTTLTANGVDVSGDATHPDPTFWQYVVDSSADLIEIIWAVTFSNSVGVAVASGSEAVQPDLGAPVAETAPSFSGFVAEGETVTINEGTYSGTTPITITGTLTLNSVDVSGDMVGDTYTIPMGTEGQDLVWTETASNGISPDAEQSVTETVSAPPDVVAPVFNAFTVGPQDVGGDVPVTAEVEPDPSTPFILYVVGLLDGSAAMTDAQKIIDGTDMSDSPAPIAWNRSYSDTTLNDLIAVPNGLDAVYDFYAVVTDSATTPNISPIRSSLDVTIDTTAFGGWAFSGSVVTNLPENEGWAFSGSVVTTIPEAA